MEVTVAQLKLISGAAKFSTDTVSNMQSVIRSLHEFGKQAGLDKRHRLAHFLAQIAEESGGFKYDREIWGPTPAQKRYEGRADLGNTQPGDGEKFAGEGPIQITGRANVTKFENWCRTQGYNPPDFTGNPDLIHTDPWEGLSAIWFWSIGNQTGKSLNVYADENNIEQVTKKINGGLNGFDERIRYYIRAALVLLGYSPINIAGFQADAQKAGFLPKDTADKKQVDGDAGPVTRSAMHMMLINASPQHEMAAIETKAAPVTSDVVVSVKTPSASVGDATAVGGVSTMGLGGGIQKLQDELTPYSMAGGWISKLVVGLIVLGGLLTVAGLIYRFWASRKKAKAISDLGATVVKP